MVEVTAASAVDDAERDRLALAARCAGRAADVSEQVARDVIDRIPTMAWSTQPDGSGEYFNRMCQDFLGLSEDALQKSQWLSAFHPDDRPHLIAHRAESLAAGLPVQTEARLRRADGQYRWVAIRVAPFRNADGMIVRWYGTHTDINERKVAEELLRQSEAFLVEAQSLSHSGSWAFEVERGVFVHWSPELSRIWGFDETVVTPPTCDVSEERVHPEDRERFASARSRAIHDRTSIDLEHRLLLPDGSIKHIQTVARLIQNDLGFVIALVGTSIDITRRKHAEAELLRVERSRVDERARERTRVAQDLHDTLLQSIQGMMLNFQTVDHLLPARAVEAKVVLRNAIARADLAVREGRDAVQGLRTATMDNSQLAAQIAQIGEQLSISISISDAPAAKPTFVVQTRGEPQDVKSVVLDDIHHIVREAVRNAYRHSFARRVDVEVVYSASLLRIRIRDDGKGIEAAVLGGEGRAGHWGLTGMRERAARIGAHCRVWSHLGAGTEIDLSVPADVVYVGRGSAHARR